VSKSEAACCCRSCKAPNWNSLHVPSAQSNQPNNGGSPATSRFAPLLCVWVGVGTWTTRGETRDERGGRCQTVKAEREPSIDRFDRLEEVCGWWAPRPVCWRGLPAISLASLSCVTRTVWVSHWHLCVVSIQSGGGQSGGGPCVTSSIGGSVSRQPPCACQNWIDPLWSDRKETPPAGERTWDPGPAYVRRRATPHNKGKGGAVKKGAGLAAG